MQRTTRQLQATSLQNTIEGNLFRTWQAYQTNLERIKSESENIKKAQQLLEIMLQRYQLNQSNTIDLREAQRSYEEAAFRLTSMQYIAKVAETELLRLAARLIVKE
jgi:outer membrane protein TolC